MRIAFVQPNTRTLQGTAIAPFGLMSIAAMAKKKGYEVKIFDKNIDFFVYSKIAKYKPDIVAVSGFTGPGLNDVLDITKELSQDAIIIVGGVHVSSLPEQSLQEKSIDYIVIGEGEYTFIELLDALEHNKDLNNIKGIGYKKDGKIIITEPRPLIQNLDELPYIAWELIKFQKYMKQEIILITSRGCPFQCKFCYNHKFNQSRWRGYSAQRVIEEIKRVQDLTDSRNLSFHDDNFTADKDRLYKILEWLNPKYNLFIETRVNYINEEFLNHFKKFKSVWFFFGVESGSQRVLNNMTKGITVEQTKKAFELLHKYNMKSTASIVIGSPTETKEELDQTFELLKEIKPTRYTYCLYTPYPGSSWYDEIVANKLFTPPKDMKGWANLTHDIKMAKLESYNFSAVSSKYLLKLENNGWIKTILNVIKEKQYHKIIMRITNLQPYLIPLLNPIDKIISRCL